MKRLITTTAMVFCVMSSNAQKQNYIKRDTVELTYINSKGIICRHNPPQYVVRKIEVGDPEYWKRVHRRRKVWDKISFGIFAAGTAAMFLITSK